MMCKLNECPQSFKQALKDSESKFWIKAINEEVASLKTNKTWIYVD